MADSEKVLYKYVGKEGQGFLPGVPAGDITAEVWKGLTKPQRVDVKGSPLYEAVEAQADDTPTPAAEAKAAPKKEG